MRCFNSIGRRAAATTYSTITFPALLGAMVGACGAQLPITAIGDINAVVQRFWNRPVALEGQVVSVQADPIGTTRGVYLLIDDSDRNGIRVQSKNLPAPGEVFRVNGVVIQDPQNTRLPLVQETDRARVNNPIFLYLMIGSGALAIVLIGALIYTLLRRPTPAAGMAAPAGGPAGMHGSWSPPPSPPPAGDGDSTFRYRQPGFDDPTMKFDYWGYRLDIVEGPDQGKSVQIGVSPFLIGRGGGRANHLELSDRTVSRSQCAIRRHPKTGEFALEHQGGTNDTLVDGKPVQAAPLAPGSRIRAGATVIRLEKDVE